MRIRDWVSDVFSSDLMAALHRAAEMLADRLMAEADAEQRPIGIGAGGDDVEADPRLIGGAGAGRDEDGVGAGRQRLGRGQRVVALDAHLRPQLDPIMDEVEGATVGIVDEYRKSAG